MADRAVVFIDGNNWFHYLEAGRIEDRSRLDYAKISLKLLGPRLWLGTRYYIGRVDQSFSSQLYADQRRFLAALQATDPKITTHLGRLERRVVRNEAAEELRRYLSTLHVEIDHQVFRDLMDLAKKHERADVWIEKAVDVMLAVEMVEMAVRNEYDAAYLLSADGDFTPAVAAVRRYGKKIYAVCPEPGHGAQLAAAANSLIRLPRDWFRDCYRR